MLSRNFIWVLAVVINNSAELKIVYAENTHNDKGMCKRKIERKKKQNTIWPLKLI